MTHWWDFNGIYMGFHGISWDFWDTLSGWCFGTCVIFPIILGMSSSQLTKSRFFFRGVGIPPTRYDQLLLSTIMNHYLYIYIMVHDVHCIVIYIYIHYSYCIIILSAHGLHVASRLRGDRRLGLGSAATRDPRRGGADVAVTRCRWRGFEGVKHWRNPSETWGFAGISWVFGGVLLGFHGDEWRFSP